MSSKKSKLFHVKAGPISELVGEETKTTKAGDAVYWGSLWCAACWAFIVASIAMGFAIDGWIRTKDIQHDSGFGLSKLSSSLTDTSSLAYLSDQAEAYNAVYNSLSSATQECITHCFSCKCAGPFRIPPNPCTPADPLYPNCVGSLACPLQSGCPPSTTTLQTCLSGCNGCSNQQNALSLSLLESVTQSVNPTCMQACRALWCIGLQGCTPPQFGNYPCCLVSCTGSQNPNCGGAVTASMVTVSAATTSP